MASPNPLTITTFARLIRSDEAYAAQLLLQNGGDLHEALDAHYRLEDTCDFSSGYIPDSEDNLIGIQEETFPWNRRTNSPADGHTTMPRDLVEVQVDMRYEPYERHVHTPSVPPINTLHQDIDDLEEEINALHFEKQTEAAKFFGYEPYERRVHTPSVPPINTFLHNNNDDSEEYIKALRFEEENQAAKFFGYEPFEPRVHTPSVPPINTSLHRMDDREDEIEERQDALAEDRQSHLQDPYLAFAISLSLETAEKEKQLGEKASRIGESRSGVSEVPQNVELQQMKFSSRSVEARNASYQNKPEDEESKSKGVPAASPDAESRYRLGTRAPHMPSPSVEAQRLIREKQDEEYYMSLRADREKENRETEARNAARRKLDKEQELEKQLTEKEASLPPESAIDEENAIIILIRMPCGNRLTRRFMKSHNLQTLFDFIDVSRLIKPNTYKLVKPFPRQTFGAEQSCVTLQELGLINKQEALFLERI